MSSICHVHVHMCVKYVCAYMLLCVYSVCVCVCVCVIVSVIVSLIVRMDDSDGVSGKPWY